MSIPFSRSLRSLRADHVRGRLALLGAAAVVLGLWSVWLFRSELRVYAVSGSGRLETAGVPRRVDAPVDGLVVSQVLRVGAAVRAGETLVELAAAGEEHALNEERALQSEVPVQLGLLDQQIAAEETSLRRRSRAAGYAVAGAEARAREASSLAGLAELEADRLRELRPAELVPELELRRAEAEAVRRRAAADAAAAEAGGLAEELGREEAEHVARIRALERERSRLEALRRAGENAVGRLETEHQLRSVVAPVSGIVAEASEARPGSFVTAGTRLATILPREGLRMVAFFEPADAMGRVREGQRARIRLDGFPWVEFGTLPAVVAGVAHEPREGMIRVELRLDGDGDPRIHLQHGLPGRAEVEVDRVSPATLVLRAAGRRSAAGAPGSGRPSGP